MTTLFQALLTAIATGTDEKKARQLNYVKVENEILRGKLPNRISFTSEERKRLVEASTGLGPMLKHLVTIVKLGTIQKWIRLSRKGYVPKKRGRRRTVVSMVVLVLKLASENVWGYTRIIGEIKKMGLRPPSKNTVKRILKEHGYDPMPKRGDGTWDEFLKRHAASLWQCDFLGKRVVTLCGGIRTAYVLVFINLKTRQVIVSPSTLHPDDEWVCTQTERFVHRARGRGLPVEYLQHDSDTKFRGSFPETLESLDVKGIRNQFRSPNLNAYVERFIQTIQQECLDRFVVLGLGHLDYLCEQFLEHYHHERPHQGLDNERIMAQPVEETDDVISLESIRCSTRLGGLLKSYSRMAA